MKVKRSDRKRRDEGRESGVRKRRKSDEREVVGMVKEGKKEGRKKGVVDSLSDEGDEGRISGPRI